MNIHNNARLTLARRMAVAGAIINQGLTRAAAAGMAGVCEAAVRKWRGRYVAEGKAGLNDRSSRPTHSPRTIKVETALAIVELRRRRLTHARIAASLGVSQSTVGTGAAPGCRAGAILSPPNGGALRT